MPAYLIAEHRITDPSRFEEYRRQVAPMIERYGGRYLTRAWSPEVLDGQWLPDRVVIIEFESMTALKAWYQSPEYQPLIAIRRSAAIDVLIALEGT